MSRFFYAYFTNTSTAQSVPPAISIHTITPCNKGLTPVFFNTCRDKPLPIKKSVSVNPACAAPTNT